LIDSEISITTFTNYDQKNPSNNNNNNTTTTTTQFYRKICGDFVYVLENVFIGV